MIVRSKLNDMLFSPKKKKVTCCSFDVQEASFEGGVFKLSNYLDSFPFPYYIVLRNIEALPRTLADLLRQVTNLLK